ncbi:helix-turn-helix domain-containing protein [Fusobacterium sp. PH5-44]|uniref:helix-turn-helix domain-containing protein n=1 Tax=unclassified Fusobacterium TaxID=2648384 RepID=UPI003D1925C0
MEDINQVMYFSDNYNKIEIIYSRGNKLFFSVHNHVSSINIGIILDGKVQIIKENSIQTYNKNQSFLILPYVSHSIKSDASFSLINISIKISTLSKFQDKEVIKFVNELLGKIENLSTIKKIIKPHILRHIKTFYTGSKVISNKPNKFIESLKIQLESFPEKQLSIDDMSKCALASKYHFIRLFKKNIGLPPHKFQLQNRIRKSQKLINQDFDINDVAHYNGFFDYSHFVKQFKKVVGLSPTTYKKCLKKY